MQWYFQRATGTLPPQMWFFREKKYSFNFKNNYYLKTSETDNANNMNSSQQDSMVWAETFERHWYQLKGITNNVRTTLSVFLDFLKYKQSNKIVYFWVFIFMIKQKLYYLIKCKWIKLHCYQRLLQSKLEAKWTSVFFSSALNVEKIDFAQNISKLC